MSAGAIPALIERSTTMTLSSTIHSPRRLRAAIVAAAVAVPLVAPASGSAHTLSLTKARSVAAVQAQKIKRDTDAKSSSVTTCARKSGHKVLCKVKSRYSTGLGTCVTDVTVYYVTHSSTRPKTTIGRSACS
jgi:hypothetical protein